LRVNSGPAPRRRRKTKKAGRERPPRESELSYLHTIWTQLPWSDRWVIAINIFLAVIFFASWRNKKRRLAREAKKPSE
jgi:hypothetical protein